MRSLSSVVLAVAVAAAGVVVSGVGPATAREAVQEAAAEASTFTPVRLGAGAITTVDLSAYVPASATAVAVNLTGARGTTATFLTAWPAAPPGPSRPM